MYFFYYGKDFFIFSIGVRNGYYCFYNFSYQWEFWSVGDFVFYGNDFILEDVSFGVFRKVGEFYGRNGLEV